MKKYFGSDAYNFIKTSDETANFNCLSNCVYEKQDETNSRYCFKQGGDEIPVCKRSGMNM